MAEAWRTLMPVLQDHLRRHGGHRDMVWLAVSGGADSMALLHTAAALGGRFGVLHVDHGYRPGSDGEAAFVRREAERRGWAYRGHTLTGLADSEHRQAFGLESAARAARYAWMAEIVGKDGLVLTGHHLDDQRETRLLHLLRGSRAESLAGMAEFHRDFGCGLGRPFLGVPKSALVQAMQDAGEEWFEDPTNRSRDHLRNRIRQELIPLLDDMRPGWESGLERIGAVALEWRGFLDGFLGTSTLSGNAFPLALLADCPSPLHALGMWGQEHGFGPAHAAELAHLADPETEVGRKRCSDRCCIIRERDALVVRPLDAGVERYAQQWNPSRGHGEIRTPDGTLSWEVETLEGPCRPDPADDTADLHLQALRPPLTLRPWRKGDRLCPLGMEGRQRISDILTQRKVPASDRAGQWVVEDADGRIVWLVGHRIGRDAALPADPLGSGDPVTALHLRWRQA